MSAATRRQANSAAKALEKMIQRKAEEAPRYGRADPIRSARLEGPPPVRLFWLELASDPIGPIGEAFSACVAYCEACKKSDRSAFSFGAKAKALEGADERDALRRLKERHECPHTETAEILLQMQFLESPER